MGMVVTVKVTSDDFVMQPHRDRTIYAIERVVEWVEEQDEPFTISQCWRATYGHYQMVSKVIGSLRSAGLITQVNTGIPKLWIRSDLA